MLKKLAKKAKLSVGKSSLGPQETSWQQPEDFPSVTSPYARRYTTKGSCKWIKNTPAHYRTKIQLLRERQILSRFQFNRSHLKKNNLIQSKNFKRKTTCDIGSCRTRKTTETMLIISRKSLPLEHRGYKEMISIVIIAACLAIQSNYWRSKML